MINSKQYSLVRKIQSENISGNKNPNAGGLSEEHKRKVSSNHADVSGKNNPMWGGHTEVAKQKMSESQKKRHDNGYVSPRKDKKCDDITGELNGMSKRIKCIELDIIFGCIKDALHYLYDKNITYSYYYLHNSVKEKISVKGYTWELVGNNE